MLSKFTFLPRIHRLLILFFVAVIIIALFFLPDVTHLYQHEKNFTVGQPYPVNVNLTHLNETAPPNSSVLSWEKHAVREGESAAILFKRLNLSHRLLHTLIHTNNDIKTQLSNLRPNDKLIFGFDENNELIQLKRILDPITSFHILRKEDNDYTSKWIKKEVNYQYNYATAYISSNFWNAGINAGLTANQIMELAGIFGWDIDFALDIRVNDYFQILYQEKIVEGEKIGRGKIVAAIFYNQGDKFTAVLDEQSGQYYDEDGRAMKKAFLRSPIDFRRVTSNFNPNRRHPVTGKITAHRGTDYAAPVGTPIWAAGDGIVEKSGYNKFNGNYVFIRHSNTYITKYLHMKKRSVRTGERVKQGQTVGTLGGTGRVTGPHLHYEFLVNGVHKNPRTVSLPQSKSLTGKRKSEFCQLAQQRLDKLSKYHNFKLTMND